MLGFCGRGAEIVEEGESSADFEYSADFGPDSLESLKS